MSTHSHCIVHIDLDAFYVQCVVKRSPELAGKPVGIVQKYLLATCSYEARSFGVTKLMRTSEALSLCPDMILVDGSDLTWFRQCSASIFRVLEGAVAEAAGNMPLPPIQKLVMEEFWIDVTRLVDAKEEAEFAPEISSWPGHLFQPLETSEPSGAPPLCGCRCVPRLRCAAQYAQVFRAAVFKALGFTCTAGVSCSKLSSKLASALHKPNAQTTVLPQHLPGLLLHRQVGELPGVGYHTKQQLSNCGIHTVHDLLLHPASVIASQAGPGWTEAAVSRLQSLGRGYDDSPVVHSGAPATVSAEDSFKACTTWADALGRTRMQLVDLVSRLEEDESTHGGRQPGSMVVTVRQVGEGRTSKSVLWPVTVHVKAGLSEAARERAVSALVQTCTPLLRTLLDYGKSAHGFNLTLINVAATNFPVPRGRQTTSNISRDSSNQTVKRRDGTVSSFFADVSKPGKRKEDWDVVHIESDEELVGQEQGQEKGMSPVSANHHSMDDNDDEMGLLATQPIGLASQPPWLHIEAVRFSPRVNERGTLLGGSLDQGVLASLPPRLRAAVISKYGHL